MNSRPIARPVPRNSTMNPMHPIGGIIDELIEVTSDYLEHLAQLAISEFKSLGFSAILKQDQDTFVLSQQGLQNHPVRFQNVRSYDVGSVVFAKLAQVAEFKRLVLEYKKETLDAEQRAQNKKSFLSEFSDFNPAKELHTLQRKLQTFMIDPNFYEQIQTARNYPNILKGKTQGEAFVVEINDLVSHLTYQIANDDEEIRSTFLNNLHDLCKKYYDHLVMKFYRDGQKPLVVTPDMLIEKGVPKEEDYLIKKINIIYQLMQSLEKDLVPVSRSDSFLGRVTVRPLQEIQKEVKNTINHQPTRDAILQHSKRMTSWFSYTTDPRENEQAWWSMFAIPTESVKFLIGVDREIASIDKRHVEIAEAEERATRLQSLRPYARRS